MVLSSDLQVFFLSIVIFMSYYHHCSYNFSFLPFYSNIWAHFVLMQSSMFRGASSFNQDIGNWDVSKGTHFVSVTIWIKCYWMINNTSTNYSWCHLYIILMVIFIFLFWYLDLTPFLPVSHVSWRAIFQSRHWWLGC